MTIPTIPAEEGKITEYWWWAYGIGIEGEGYAANATINVTAPDPNGWYWREFTTTTDATGKFSLRINTMKNRSTLGNYTVIAKDDQNNTADANFTVIKNPKEVINVQTDVAEISMPDFYYNGGLKISSSNHTPNEQVFINLIDPSGNTMDVEPLVDKFADANGNFEIKIDGTTEFGNYSQTYSLPEIPGSWSISVNEFEGNDLTGAGKFRLLPLIPEEYCVPHIAYEVQPISNVEFNDLTNSSSTSSTVGYEDFTDKFANIEAGKTYALKIKGKSKWNFNVDTYTAFIDWNHNGILDEENEVYSLGFLKGSTGEADDSQEISFDIDVPENAINGDTRMRILKVNSASTTALFWPSGSCGIYGYGQIEDYNLKVTNDLSTSEIKKTSIKYYPNPVKDVLTISNDQNIEKVTIFDLTGREVFRKEINTKNSQLNLAHLSSGVYIVKTISNGKENSFKIVKK